MTGQLPESRRILPLLDPGSIRYESRRRFLKRVLAGTTLAIVAAATGFPNRVDASSQLTATSPTTMLDVGRLKVATQNSAKFTIPERDQTHCLYNNTWHTPNDPHEQKIVALWSPSLFEAMAFWSWGPSADGICHGYPEIIHGRSPWFRSTTDDRFPFPISKYGSLALDLPNVYVNGDGKWGLGFDVWICAEPFSADTIKAELFIMQKRLGYGNPRISGTVSSKGVGYNYGQWAAGDRLHFFWRQSEPAAPFRLQIDIYDFINFLKAKGIVKDSDLVAGVEFGAEPIEGSGMWRIDSFYTTLIA